MVEQSKDLTEYQKRLKRAERFGLDPSTVVPPDSLQKKRSEVKENVWGEMQKGSKFEKVEKLEADIAKIKQR
jgi:hypothetical protein